MAEAESASNARGLPSTVFEMLSPAGRRGRLTILMFHRVRERPDGLFPNEMHAAVFRERMSWIRAWFNVLPLDEATAALSRGTLPARALAITFDDGYDDNYTVAMPILRELGLHATFFVATAFLDGGRMWNDTVIEAVRGTRGGVLDLSSIELDSYRVESLADRRRTIDAILPKLKYLAPNVRDERAASLASIAGVAPPA